MRSIVTTAGENWFREKFAEGVQAKWEAIDFEVRAAESHRDTVSKNDRDEDNREAARRLYRAYRQRCLARMEVGLTPAGR